MSDPEPALTLAARRGQLTVMFCDLAGSTELSNRLDPEDFLEITNTCLSFFARCIEDAGGFVARYAGDGVLAYFGYPQTHEDDPARAVSCALSIRDNLPRISASIERLPAVRIGIATGLAVVGESIGSGPSQEYPVSGQTPNIAARLQSAAAADTVLVSAATRNLSAALFEFRPLGQLALKGLPAGTEAWEAIAPRATIDRFAAHGKAALTMLVGREAELAQVLDAWHRREGGRVVGLIGEPGIGKSRLLHEVRESLNHAPPLWLDGGGAQIFKDTPFHVVTQMIRRSLGSNAAQPAAGGFSRLEALLHQAGMSGEDLALIAELLDLETPETGEPLTMGPDEKRRRLISTLVGWLLKTAARRPTVIAIEDIHWADPSTLAFLDELVREIGSVPLLVVYTARQDAALQWHPACAHERILLGRLSDDECRHIVKAVAGGALAETIVDRIVSLSNGMPLFAEELVRHAGEVDEPDFGIPSTLSALLLARLEQLGPAKRVVHIASVLGMEFHLSLLRSVARLGDADLQSALAALVRADVLVESGEDGTYRFRHALIRDAAYESLLKSRRRALHIEVASAIAEQFAAFGLARPEVLAQHWSAACEFGRAIDAWQEAGRSASHRRAYAEAQTAYERAIALVGELPASQRRDQRELELQSAYAGVLQITMGYSAAATTAVTETARRLASRTGDLRKQCAHIAGAWMAASSSGDYALAMRLADRLMPFALAEMSPDGLGIAHMIQMTSRYRTGDLVGAEESFRAGTDFFASTEFQLRPGAAAQTFGNAAVNACILDRAAEARGRGAACLEICSRGGNPYDLAFAQQMAAMSSLLMDDAAAALGLAEQSMRTSDRHGFPQFAAISRIVMGRAEAALGRVAQGLSRIGEGVEMMTRNRSRNGITMYLTWLAEAQLADGSAGAALDTLNGALRENPQELFFRPEGLRLRAEVRLRLGDAAQAATDCREAVVLAKRMGAKLFHGRAAAALDRLPKARSETRPR